MNAWGRFSHGWRHRRHHPHIRVILIVGNVAVEIPVDGVIHMATSLNVGQTVPLSIKYLDQNGAEMVPTPTPDAPPAWAQTNSAAALLTASADGNTATAKGTLAGDDVVQLDLAVGGKSFTATLDLTIVAAAPVLTSVEIVAGPPA